MTEELLKAGEAPIAKAAAGTGTRPIAVVGVHGISPIQQYGFQDQLAMGLLGYLNAVETAASSGRTWFSTTYWPRVSKKPSHPVLKPSALRLYRDDETDPETPRGRVYDVYEGYWSPFSKGKTNIASLLTWLLRCTFLATSSTARVPATWKKLFWDVGYLIAAIVAAVVCLVLAVVAGGFAFLHFVSLIHAGQPAVGAFPNAMPEPPAVDFSAFLHFILNPLGELKLLPWTGWVQLALDVVLAYLIVQLVVVARTRIATRARTAELRRDGRKGGRFEAQTIEAESFHTFVTVLLVVFVALLALVDVLMLQYYHPGNVWSIMWHGAWLVLAVGLFQAARGIADFVVEDVLGDVQVYCTHDCNSSFYAVRSQIIDAVSKALLGALTAVAPKTPAANADTPLAETPLYEKIHVAGHSLGTTVGLDVLIRLRQLVEEGSVDEADWLRIRSFTTFGTALEKTRFLLDVRNPTVSAAQQQWQNDSYGRFFTDHRSTLLNPDNEHGIFWSNHWYFHDIVANEIVTYKSDVEAGEPFASWTAAPHEHEICENNLIAHPKPFWAFVHSDYIGDSLFWKNAGPVFTS